MLANQCRKGFIMNYCCAKDQPTSGISILDLIASNFNSLRERLASPKARKMKFHFHSLMESLVHKQEKWKKSLLFYIRLCDYRHYFNRWMENGFQPSTLKRWNPVSSMEVAKGTLKITLVFNFQCINPGMHILIMKTSQFDPT